MDVMDVILALRSISHLYRAGNIKGSGKIKGSINAVYSKNVNLEVPVRLSFQSLPSFLGKEKSTKCT